MHTWGKYDKDDLKSFTFLDHAVDAIVIADLVPAYAEIAQVQMKLTRLFRKNHYHVTDEYRQIEDNCINTMKKFYHMSENYVRGLLENKTEAVSPIIPRLNDEVDFRVCDIQSFKYFDSKSKAPQNLTDEQICELFRSRIVALYADDPSFAAGISMTVTSYKQSFSLQSSLSKDQALSIVNVDGTEYKKVRKPIGDITLKLVDKIYSSDDSLKSSLKKLLNGNGRITVKEALEKQRMEKFVTDSGMEYKHVSLLTAPNSYFVKEIGAHDEAMTQREIAKQLRISRSYISRIEKRRWRSSGSGLRRGSFRVSQIKNKVEMLFILHLETFALNYHSPFTLYLLYHKLVQKIKALHGALSP